MTKIRRDSANTRRARKAQKNGERPNGPTFTVVRRLPAGVDVEQARHRCAEALAAWLAGEAVQ